MLLRQFFDRDTYTYTYLIADKNTREACLIDPVFEHVSLYLNFLQELDLKLILALDTHVHADHITALGKLRDATSCNTLVGSKGEVKCASDGFSDGKYLPIGDLNLKILFTPGHTDDSYSFYLEHKNQRMVFTGDTLFIRGTGRTDFQNGNAEKLFNSLHNKLLTLPGDTIVYPGHDYKGWTKSTIDEEKKHNPRLLIKEKKEFVEHMNNLDLPNPKWMDVAVPANKSCGKRQDISHG